MHGVKPKLAQSFEIKRTEDGGAKIAFDGEEFPFHISENISVDYGDSMLATVNIGVLVDNTRMTVN